MPSAFSLDDLDAWMRPRSLRRYQQLIIDQIPFALNVQGHIYDVLDCQASVNVNRLMLRRRVDAAPYRLESSSCGTGFSLEGQQPVPIDAASPSRPALGGPPVLRAGDANFAHFLWNELDPLLHLAQQAQQRSETLPVVQDSLSIVDLASLPGVERLPAEVLNTRTSLHAGAMWVSAAARSTVLASLGAPPAARRRPGDPPLVLLGVRGPGRRELIDEVELLIGLMSRLQRRWPGLKMALDGFTVQQNHHQDPSNLKRAAAIGERIRTIQEAFAAGSIESLHELPFQAYLPRVAQASAYVTHEGTIQHKIGWLYPEIPGICLVAGPHARAIAAWHLLQCEGSSKLDVLPDGLLVHLNQEIGQPPHPEQRNQPFHAPDPIAAIEAIETLLAPHLADRPADPRP